MGLRKRVFSRRLQLISQIKLCIHQLKKARASVRAAMAACGHCFTLVVTEDGGVCAWGLGQGGQLGLNNREVFHAPMVLVAAGGA